MLISKHKIIKNLLKDKKKNNEPISRQNVLSYASKLIGVFKKKPIDINHVIHNPEILLNSKELDCNKKKEIKKVFDSLVALSEIIRLMDKIDTWKKTYINESDHKLEKSLKDLDENIKNKLINEEECLNEKEILIAEHMNNIDDIEKVSEILLSFSFYGRNALNKSKINDYKKLISKFYNKDECEIIEESIDIIHLVSELLDLNDDLVAKYYLQALSKTIEKNNFKRPHYKLYAAAISFSKKIDLINSLTYLFFNIQKIIALATSVYSVLEPYLSQILIFLPVMLVTPRLITNIGKSLYYHQKNKNWDYFHSVKYQILADLYLVATSIAFTVSSALTCGSSTLLVVLLQDAFFVACYVGLAIYNGYQKYRYNKKVNAKINNIDKKIDNFIKTNNESGGSPYEKNSKYQELIFLKKSLTAEKHKKNRLLNANIIFLIAGALVSPVLFFYVGKNVGYLSTLHSAIKYSSFFIPKSFLDTINNLPSAVSDNLNSMVAYFKNKNKTKNKAETLKTQPATP